ncbi:MAG: DNA translocase FtsK 4TM domain-containing protein [Myxococcota bacterium]
MAKKREGARRGGRRASSPAASDGWRSRLALEGLGLALVALSLLALLAVASHDPKDPVFELAPVNNRAGAAGASLAALLFGGFGWGSIVLVVAGLVLGGRLLLRLEAPGLVSRFWFSSALLLLSLTTLPSLLHTPWPAHFASDAGGALGSRLGGLEQAWLSVGGALLINVLALCVGALGVVGFSAGEALLAVGRALGFAARQRRRGVGLLRGAVLAAGSVLRTWARQGLAALEVWRERRARRVRVVAQLQRPGPEPGQEDILAALRAVRKGKRDDPDIVDHRVEEGAEPEQGSFSFSESTPSGPYELPDIGIFERPPAGGRTYDRDSLIMNSRILEKKLSDFGVTGRVVTVHPGPVITMYEFEPASGVKVNRIVNLADDLALALRALSVRIIAPLPGKSVVGIEVPNAEREIVYLREALESDGFRKSESRLTLALGKDIFGNPVEADLARMPHLLVAGATGTGKSVFLNSLLCSLLCRATPDELKLLLIDPKLLELSVYEGIPHLIADVVTNPKRAAAALAGIVHKMEERYQMMLALGVRNIAQFNARVDAELAAGKETFRLRPKGDEEEGALLPLRSLAYIMVVIDELADLMVVSARDVEESLQRLAQMARAAGIHLVLATQRPSVDVLTGIIKANFPARISFQVSSRTDSRTILDQNGADHLLGAGDMLFLPPGTSKLQRIHGCYVSEKEVKDLAVALRSQGKPSFDETLLRLNDESEQKEERGEDVDDLYDRALAIVAETRNASISYLQRRLKVGYNRAARMIEQMEQEGVVGPQEGTRPRDIFVRPFDVE